MTTEQEQKETYLVFFLTCFDSLVKGVVGWHIRENQWVSNSNLRMSCVQRKQ